MVLYGIYSEKVYVQKLGFIIMEIKLYKLFSIYSWETLFISTFKFETHINVKLKYAHTLLKIGMTLEKKIEIKIY